ncbi:MAG: GH1 family beta-glucosidase [Chloroflexota bacterium]|nr:GH1 family beta-glucosidase [Chloroflexota bacterium]
MSSASVVFPDDWVWGAATAAYQIEGAVRAGGRGQSIWDTFSHTPGKIVNGDTGDIACDHFHRYPDDIALMRELGLGGYRFSIAWPRIFPTGSGRPNTEGIDFYRRLIDELHTAGITPYVTLYHWDLPQPLQDRGGWGNRDTAHRFGEYVQTVAAALGAGVQHWFTINEPWVAAFLGHWTGDHAPGARDFRLALLAAHNLLLAHGEGMAALRSEMRPGDEAGIVINLAPSEPADDSNADLEAAHRMDGFVNRWFLDALYRGVYPDDMVRLYGDAMPEIAAGDMDLISRPTDVLGVNYYSRSVVAYDPAAMPLHTRRVTPPSARVTAMGWEIFPSGLYDVLQRVHDDYAPGRLLVTENGAALDDVLDEGVVDDPAREDFLHEHLLQVYWAIQAGVPVAGYFAWSLLDNFEWAWGYSARFGLIFVDFATQERIVKRSGRWYSEVTRENVVGA